MRNSTTRIKLLVICIFAMTYSANMFAQKANTLQLLQKEWIAQFPEKKNFTVKLVLSPNKWKEAFIFNEKTNETNSPFYLSDKSTTEFDQNKVGKTTVGQYLIVQYTVKELNGSFHKKIENFEILKLTDTDLELKHLASGSILQYKCK